MAALEYFGLAQFIIAIVILIFASYSDLKLRKVSDIAWVTMGLAAMVIFGLQLFLYNESALIFLGLMPILGILCYFLICEWMVDFDERELNLPWVFILIICFTAIVVQAYWIGFPAVQIYLIILFFFSFLSLEFVMFYLDYIHYMTNADQSTVESEGVTKESKPVRTEGSEPKEKSGERAVKKTSVKKRQDARKPKKDTEKRKKTKDRKDELPSSPEEGHDLELDGGTKTKETKLDLVMVSSWIFFILILVHVITSLAVYQMGIDTSSLTFILGILGIMIPIVIFVLYLVFFEWSLFPKSESTLSVPHADEDRSKDDDLESEDEGAWIPRKRSAVEKMGWCIIIIVGFILTMKVVEFSLENDIPDYYAAMFSVQIWLIMFYAMYNLGIPKGGADTKALMALSVLFPIYIFKPLLIDFSFFTSEKIFSGIAYIFPFAFSVLINATVISLFVPLCLVIYNATKSDLKFPYCAFGYKMNINDIPKKHVWLMDQIDEKGNISTVLIPRQSEKDTEMIKEFEKHGHKNAWVTPKIPFIIPMAVGFLLIFLIGNILFTLIFGLGGY